MGKLQDCLTFLYDRKEKRVFGRDKKGWAEISAFFVVFYVILLSFFCSMLSFFFQTMSERTPYLVGDEGFLVKPGMGFRPQLMSDDGLQYMSVIYFTKNPKETHTRACIKSLTNALKVYKDARDEQYVTYWKDCDSGSTPTKYQSCKILYDELVDHGCDENNNFGYPQGSPCVLLRLNKIYNWKPEPYKTYQRSMPARLSSVIKAHTQANKPEMVWLHCFGYDDLDQENIGNQTLYIPGPGFQANHFPYLNQIRHLPPVVMVKFASMKPNVVIKVQCKAFAKNLDFNIETWEAGVHFELFYKTAK